LSDCGKKEQNRYKIALRTALAQTDINLERIEFISEGEACLNAYALNRERHFVAGKEYLLIDAGGGTIDL